MRRVSHKPRPAFTLVELMMVVTIIGILVGLLVPAVYYAMRSVKRQAIGIELQTLANAIDQYKNKYNDYPPDGSNARIFVSHFRTRFPQILESEFLAVANSCDASNGAPATAYMDPPEALVFALGGFSSDPTRPFTGPGGPIVVSASTPVTYQYNTDRNEPLYEFKEAQLTLEVSSGLTVSTDERVYGYGATDIMPAYRQPYGKQSPFVYFDSRSYSFPVGATVFFNNYGTTGAGYGFARPYKSDKLNTNVGTSASVAEAYYKYMNDRTFQLIAAGLDDNFGGMSFTSGNGPVLYRYPTGESIDFSGWNATTAPVVGSRSRYDDGDVAHPQLDNVANFADGIFENGLEN